MTAYTVPRGKSVVNLTIVVCNREAGAASFRVAIIPKKQSLDPRHYIYYDLPINGNDTFANSIGIGIGEEDAIVVYASSSGLSFGLWGNEV